jgi:putative oxidoreductase
MYEYLVEIVGRTLIALLYIFQAMSATQRFGFHAGRLRERGVPAPNAAFVIALAMMFVGGILMLLNIFPRYGATLLLVFTVAATILFHNFWSIRDAQLRRDKRKAFVYNLAIIGGLLLVLSRGPPYAGF